jgi:hypothetical protein
VQLAAALPIGRGMSWRVARVPCVIAIVMSTLWPAASPAHASEAGKVRFVNEADSSFDHNLRGSTPPHADWMRAHYWRQKTYAPFFDQHTAWYPNAWTYKDAYAIYVDGRDPEVTLQRHPDWVLRDAAGKPLYIPFGCSGGTCPQYAADIGNPAFRAQWIAKAKATLAQGYRGLFVDDVNLELKVADGNGDEVAPFDPRTGRAMTLADWRRTMADFVEQIRAEVRAANPDVEIAHNAIWFSGHDDPAVKRELLAADYLNLERGVNDDLHAGNDRFALTTFLEHIDWLHAHGKGVVLDSYADTQDAAEYNLAAYFLIATDRDGMRTNYRSRPGDWWPGYDVDLGQPRGDRYGWEGLVRRDFDNGFAVVNLPGGAPRTLQLPADARAADGTPRASASLPPASGRVVLTQAPGAPAGPPAAGSIVLKTVPNPRVKRRGQRGQRRLARAALIRGRVRGSARRGKLAVSVQRRQRGHWRTVRQLRVHVRKARFRRLLRRLPKGTYRVRAQHRQPRGRTVRAARHFRVRR